MKTVFITAQVINERNYERYAIRQIEEKSDVIVVDVTNLLYPKVFEQQYIGRKHDLNVVYIHDMEQLRRVGDEWLYMDYIFSLLGGINEDNYKIFELLKPYQDKLCVLALAGFPSKGIGINDGLLTRLLIKMRRESSWVGVVKKIKHLLTVRIRIKGVLKARYLVSCGLGVTEQYSMLVGENTQVIKLCSYDYAQSLASSSYQERERYIVFLDENLINHTDYVINNVVVEDEVKYYQELKKFFSYLELKSSARIIVAAHPRADVEYTKKMLSEYEIVQGKTAALVRGCYACVTHASTSSNFAVIYNKPIIFLTSNRMKRTRKANDILASWFGRKPINMSSVSEYQDVELHMRVDSELYDRYFSRFISYSMSCEFGYDKIFNQHTGEEVMHE
jgi:hypothetical protein